MTSTRDRVLTFLLFACLAIGAPVAGAAEAKYGQVSKAVGKMLEDHHYSQLDFEDHISRQLLENYFEALDYNRRFFTQEDITRFQAQHSNFLDDQVKAGNADAAFQIYDLYEKRVRERIAKVTKLLEEGEFDYTLDETIEISRKDSTWPTDEVDADNLWRLSIKNQLLQEHLALIAEQKAKKESEEEDESPSDENSNSPESELEAEAEPEEKKDPDREIRDKLIKRWDRVLKSLDDNDKEEVVNIFLTALAMTYDPHSDYFSFRDLANFEISMRHSLTGIGAMLSMVDGMAEIQGLVVAGPAHKSKQLNVNDRIVAVGQGIEGEMVDIVDMKLPKVVELIRGQKGSIVRLKVVPAGSDSAATKEIVIVRDTVELKDKLANAELIETKDVNGQDVRIGWINLYSFYADMNGGSTSTTVDVRRLLERLMRENIDGLVLDLRGNGGGSLEEAINLTGLFIQRGPVVQSKDWRGNIDFRRSRNRYPVYDGPLVVLTDKASASASEILAAALQDYNRSLIVGEKSTFGKGTVQTIMHVSREMPIFADRERAGALKVTIQKFYRIAGGSTQLRGVVPDLTLPFRTDALEIGEESLENPLAYDTIPPQQFVPHSATPFPTQALRDRLHKRIAHDPEFQYVMEDSKRIKERFDKNLVSLNKEERLREAAENKQRLEDRDAERRDRFAKIRETEKGLYTTYKLTLDNVDETTLTLRDDFSKEESSGMIMAGSDSADESLEYPHGFEPVKREALHVLEDLIEINRTNAARTVKVSNPPGEKEPAPARVP